MICNSVVTYYSQIPGHWSPAEDEQKLIELWQHSWRKYGWDPIVLTEADVKSHPRYAFFHEIFSAKPSEYGVAYCNACWLRWLAAAHYSSLRTSHTMLVDYDVINHGFEPQEIEPGKLKIFCDEPPSSVFMGAVMGSSQHFLDMAELFASWAPDSYDWNAHANCFHQDDLNQLVRMFESKSRPKPDFFVKVPGCSLFDYSSWRTAKLVHYGYAMRGMGYSPKHEWIPKLRPV